ncbi:MAG: putative rhomboid protease [Vezdaea aestivalis]|nr:MAG: putative rhomboid protease [Vezdaea aestivalis]
MAMYRINTYPLIHANLFHALLCTTALTPLLERFESENGTLLSLAMFAGPLSTFPAGLYLLFERGLWRGNTAIMGASIWVFVLLGIEAMKAFRTTPSLSIGPYKVPTWTLPLILTVFVSLLLSTTSLLGHLCATGVGYLYGLGYLKFMAPPEKILRWFESKLNLLGRLPHYVSVDQKTFGRYGILPSTSGGIATNV